MDLSPSETLSPIYGIKSLGEHIQLPRFRRPSPTPEACDSMSTVVPETPMVEDSSWTESQPSMLLETTDLEDPLSMVTILSCSSFLFCRIWSLILSSLFLFCRIPSLILSSVSPTRQIPRLIPISMSLIRRVMKALRLLLSLKLRGSNVGGVRSRRWSGSRSSSLSSCPAWRIWSENHPLSRVRRFLVFEYLGFEI